MVYELFRVYELLQGMVKNCGSSYLYVYGVKNVSEFTEMYDEIWIEGNLQEDDKETIKQIIPIMFNVVFGTPRNSSKVVKKIKITKDKIEILGRD